MKELRQVSEPVLMGLFIQKSGMMTTDCYWVFWDHCFLYWWWINNLMSLIFKHFLLIKNIYNISSLVIHCGTLNMLEAEAHDF